MPESQDPKEPKDLTQLIQKIWLPIAGFLGAVTLAYNFYMLWWGDQKTVFWFLAGGGFLLTLIALLWVGFGRQTVTRNAVWPIGAKVTESRPRYFLRYRRMAWIGLALLALFSIVGGKLLTQRHAVQEQKLIVLMTVFDGPEEVYGVRNEILEKLSAEFAGAESIEIIAVDNVITPAQGSAAARQLGADYLADVVIWGWYRPTENPNITIHIENLATEVLLPLPASSGLQLSATLSELESFSLQQQLGRETAALVSFLAGYIDFRAKNYAVAIPRFDAAIANLDVTPRLLQNLAEIYSYRGVSYSLLGRHERAIEDYDHAIQLDPQDAVSYNNRGLAYGFLSKYERAIEDFNHSIQLDSQNGVSYFNRGLAYYSLRKQERAIEDFNRVIQIDSLDAAAYVVRGLAYDDLGKYERAIEDFDRAIQIDPQYSLAYAGRGFTYRDLGKYERAIEDFDRAILLGPQDVLEAATYLGRGLAYADLGKPEQAIEDYDRAIKIDSQYAVAFYSRGLAYVDLDKYEQAIEDFDRTIQIDPQDANAYVRRGLSYSYLGKYEQAIEDYSHAILLDPQYALAYYGRGLVYQALGDTVKAEADFATYTALTGKSAP